MKDDKIYWVWLSRIEGISLKEKMKLIHQFQSPKNLWNLTRTDKAMIQEKVFEKLVDKKYKEKLENYMSYMERQNINLISILDKHYPKKLKNIYDPPIVLYYKGNLEIINEFSVAMIGCRQCSTYGKEMANLFSKLLTEHKINIISGLARGIDSYSHLNCLRNKGKTVAVLGNGLDTIYPKENTKLANQILQNNGLILSEYVIGTKPLKRNFPARNRIISGLSSGVLVIEAKQKSGTLITVDFALEQGKNVYVLPGNITSTYSSGTNELLKQGAKLVTNVQDILEDYPETY